MLLFFINKYNLIIKNIINKKINKKLHNEGELERELIIIISSQKKKFQDIIRRE